MSEQTTDSRIEVASVTDRGLSEKRPLNEDSMLVDAARGIFAVADGVGGAEAGEVASQTAIEVVEEAFRHHKDGDDIEDLMEIAIQRANSSIHQMSREHPKLSMMATTIVALHLDGRRATIGHVGDSRLYRLAPDGRLLRETEDHSVVEEEVRAGRMTPEQAVNHPSRNVISRALGAEAAVEVDLKTLEVEDGTGFLLCSDGITRHIPDDELREILGNGASLDAACAEMKRRCFERGAEDNLTAVVVRIGGRGASVEAVARDEDEEPTIIAERSAFAGANALPAGAVAASQASHLRRPFDDTAPSSVVENVALPVPVVPAGEQTLHAHHAAAIPRDAPSSRTPTGRAGRTLGVLIFLIAASALAFAAGMRYKQWKIDQTPPVAAAATPVPTPQAVESRFEQRRREVDRNPSVAAARMESETAGVPLDSPDPVFLYLYGRALLLSGKSREAGQAFQRSIDRISAAPETAEMGQLRVDAVLATAAAALKSNDVEAQRSAVMRLESIVAPQQNIAPQDSAPLPEPSLAPTAPLP